jgi:hypothetical protein
MEAKEAGRCDHTGIEYAFRRRTTISATGTSDCRFDCYIAEYTECYGGKRERPHRYELPISGWQGCSTTKTYAHTVPTS